MTQDRKSNIIVAGGAGFVGSHLCELLLDTGANVLCVDNLQTGRPSNVAAFRSLPQFDMLEADIVEVLPSRMLKFKPTHIFNLACAASPPHYQADPEHTMLTSVVGMQRLLRLAETSGARVLQASTSEVYGDPEVHPQREGYWGHVNPTGPRACYDEGKRAAESLCFDFLRAGRADVRVARIFNTYGPKMRADDGRVISNIITQALSGADITVYGSGEQTRSFCYVDDLVRGLVSLMRCDRSDIGPVNLGNPVELTVRDVVERVLEMTGSPSKVVSRPLPTDDPQRRRPDISRAKDLLGWSPGVPLEKGLQATIDYFAAEQPSSAVLPARHQMVPASATPAE